jgi:hypothetical protein
MTIKIQHFSGAFFAGRDSLSKNEKILSNVKLNKARKNL